MTDPIEQELAFADSAPVTQQRLAGQAQVLAAKFTRDGENAEWTNVPFANPAAFGNVTLVWFAEPAAVFALRIRDTHGQTFILTKEPA